MERRDHYFPKMQTPGEKSCNFSYKNNKYSINIYFEY